MAHHPAGKELTHRQCVELHEKLRAVEQELVSMQDPALEQALAAVRTRKEQVADQARKASWLSPKS